MCKKIIAVLTIAVLLITMPVAALADFELETTAQIEIRIFNPLVPATSNARPLLFPHYVNQEWNGSIEWSSSNPQVAIVDEYGTITGVQEGTCIVQGVLTNNSGVSSTKTAQVTVVYAEVNFDKTEYTSLKVGDSLDLRPVHHPFFTTSFVYGSVKWETENIDVAHVDVNGIVTGMSPGICTITSIHEHPDKSISTKQTVFVIEV